MKIKILFLCLTLICLSGCQTNEKNKMISSEYTKGEGALTESENKSEQIDNAKVLPVNADKIKNALGNAGRFTASDIPHYEDGTIDVHWTLDKSDGDGIADFFYQIDTIGSTDILSYNFSKENAENESVRWGLDIVFSIFDIELTDEIWNDIMGIALKNEEVGVMGTDHKGYENEDKGIKLIYADLGKNIQIDFEPYE